MSVSSSARTSARRGGIDESIFARSAAPKAPAVDPMALLALMQQGQQHQLQNIRSPMVRRNMSGGVVDETAPSGIDTLRDLPHSWDQTYNNSGHGGYGNVNGAGVNNPEPPQTLFRGAHGNAVVTPYGGGYSPFAGQTMGTTPVSTYGADPAMTAAEGKRPVVQRDAHGNQTRPLASNVTAAYNDTLMSPFQTLLQQHIQANPGGSTYDSGRGVDSSIFQQPPAQQEPLAAAQPQQVVPPVDSHYSVPPVLADHSNKAAIPTAARAVAGWGADLGDSVVNALWDSNHGSAFRNEVSPFVDSPAAPQPTAPEHPALYSDQARQARLRERQKITQPLNEADNFQPSGEGTGFEAQLPHGSPADLRALEALFNPTATTAEQHGQEDRQFQMEMLIRKLFPDMLPAYR